MIKPCPCFRFNHLSLTSIHLLIPPKIPQGTNTCIPGDLKWYWFLMNYKPAYVSLIHTQFRSPRLGLAVYVPSAF